MNKLFFTKSQPISTTPPEGLTSFKSLEGSTPELVPTYKGSNIKGINNIEGISASIIPQVANIASSAISGNFSTGAGTALKGLGMGLSFIPGWGWIAGAASSLLGGIVDRGFGTIWNNENIGRAKSNIAGLNAFNSTASNFDTLQKEWEGINNSALEYKASDFGEDGWFVNRTGKMAANFNKQHKNALDNAFRELDNEINNIGMNTLNNLERNYAALGGPLFAYGGQTHGADFTNGLIFINNGGTHENNPYEGVPISMDKEGNPNLVEEGEVIWDNYVFSDRLKIPKSIRKKYKLGKKEITFADAIDKLSKESEERPNDPISINGLNSFMTDFIITQEKVKQNTKNKSNNMNKFAKGGSPEIKNPYNSYGYIPGYNRGWYNNNGEYTQEYRNLVNALTKNQLLSAMNRNYTWYSNPKNVNTDRYKAIEKFYTSNPYFNQKLTELSDDMFTYAKQLALDGNPGYMHDVIAQLLANQPIATVEPEGLRGQITINPDIAKETLKNKNVYLPKNIKSLPTWMRYVPAIGAGIGVLTDALGLTNKPNYTNADAIIKATKEAAVYDPIKFKPIGDYLTYNPFDTEYHANQLRAVSGATRRNIMNTSGGNRATAMAGILASDNNTMNQLGDLYRKAAEYNLEQRQKVADFNRATNMFNSEGFYKADATNQSAALQAKGLGLEGLMKGYAMKEQAKLMSDQAKAANINGLFTNLGKIGYENANRNMANWSIANGTWAPSQWIYNPFN